MGSLYPPIGYPTLARLDNAQVAFLKREIHVAIDDRAVFDAPAYCYPASPGTVRFGLNSLLPDSTAAKFSGRILAVSRAPIVPLAGSPHGLPPYGALRLVLRFPPHQAGRCEPLVVTGIPQAGDFIYVRYIDDRHVSFGLDHWGGKGGECNALPVDFSVAHTVEISMGSLFPAFGHPLLSGLPPATRARLKDEVQILLDGAIVFAADRGTYESPGYDVTVGRNAIGGSVCDYAFTGTIERTERLGLPSAPSKQPDQ
jgi:hypothetical protein